MYDYNYDSQEISWINKYIVSEANAGAMPTVAPFPLAWTSDDRYIIAQRQVLRSAPVGGGFGKYSIIKIDVDNGKISNIAGDKFVFDSDFEYILHATTSHVDEICNFMGEGMATQRLVLENLETGQQEIVYENNEEYIENFSLNNGNIDLLTSKASIDGGCLYVYQEDNFRNVQVSLPKQLKDFFIYTDN